MAFTVLLTRKNRTISMDFGVFRVTPPKVSDMIELQGEQGTIKARVSRITPIAKPPFSEAVDYVHAEEI